MKGNYYYQETKREIKKTAERINFPLEEREITLIANYWNWRRYSGACITNDLSIRVGSKLDLALVNAKIDYDYPELAE